jgi:hypothetical protein
MILERDGKPIEILLNDLIVGFECSIKNKEIGNKSSSTGSINEGTKPKILTVTGVCSYENKDNLIILIKMAETTDNEHRRAVYTISDNTADVAEIREVIFHNSLSVKKMNGLQAWNVSFSLREYNSVVEAAERKKIIEKKEKAKLIAKAPSSTTTQPPNATTTTISTDTSKANTEANMADVQIIEDQHGLIYDMLKKLDQFLEPNNEDNKTT